MTKSTPSAAAQPQSESPLADALEKNQETAEEVKKAAEDLSVAHAVLDTKATDRVVDDDTKRAVAETGKIEKRLSGSAEKLDQVNEALAKEMKKPS
jgi:hypothetical protein